MNRDQRHLDIETIEDLLRSQSGFAVPREVFPQEIQQHLNQCEECRKLLEMYEQSGKDLGSLRLQEEPGSFGCPQEELLRELAAGTADSVQATELMEHVFGCARCGPMYREISDELSSDLTAEEESLIAGVRLSRPSAQLELARSLAKTSTSIPKSGFSWRTSKSRFRIRILIFSGLAATLVACAVLVWILHSREYSSPNEQLAEAYSEQRPFDFRFEDAPYGPIRIERGSHLGNSKSESLIEAELRIKRGLSERPDDPELLESKGKAELLELETSDAIEDLSSALNQHPDSPTFLSNLGIAYAQRGDEENQPSDYRKAIELLKRASQADPSNRVALFNRAILNERLQLTDDARKDWEAYLKLDENGDWAREARQHLERIQN